MGIVRSMAVGHNIKWPQTLLGYMHPLHPFHACGATTQADCLGFRAGLSVRRRTGRVPRGLLFRRLHGLWPLGSLSLLRLVRALHRKSAECASLSGKRRTFSR